MQRSDVQFDSAGSRCAAWLYIPDRPGPHPCVILAHGFGGIRSVRLEAYAARFAEAGLAALVFDYRHFGASEGEPRQLLDLRRQLADWAAAVVWARSCPALDPARIGLWGTSLSGGHVLVTAARDRRIAAVVAQVPFVDGLAVARRVPPARVLRLALAALRDVVRQWRRRAPLLIASIGAPGDLAAMTLSAGTADVEASIPPDVSWDRRVASRVFLTLPWYRPVNVATQVQCPLLICICEGDTITPPAPAIAVATIAPRGALHRYPGEHFDIYAEPLFAQAVADQVAFFTRHLLARSV